MNLSLRLNGNENAENHDNGNGSKFIHVFYWFDLYKTKIVFNSNLPKRKLIFPTWTKKGL
jgi:hypothetical protein